MIKIKLKNLVLIVLALIFLIFDFVLLKDIFYTKKTENQKNNFVEFLSTDLKKIEENKLYPVYKMKKGKVVFINKYGKPVFEVNEKEYTDIGESQFINATGFMQSLENTLTYQEMDKYIGRGRVMTPQFSNSKNGILATLQGKSRGFNILDYSFMTPYSAETGSLDSKVPVQPVQFNLRSAEWKLALEEAEAKVCLRCGLSVLDFDPSLATTMRTATEVNYMNDITANTVKSKRALLKYELDRLVSDIAKQLGLEISVFVVFDNSTIVDKVQNQALILQQYQSGLISLDTAVKQLHPEWKQEEVEAELDRINLERGGTRVDDNFNNILGV